MTEVKDHPMIVASNIAVQLLEDAGIPYVYAAAPIEAANGGFYVPCRIWVSDADIAREQADMEEFEPAPDATGEGTDRCQKCNQMRVEHPLE